MTANWNCLSGGVLSEADTQSLRHRESINIAKAVGNWMKPIPLLDKIGLVSSAVSIIFGW